MDYRETPLFFDCEGAALLGLLAVPEEPARVGVVVVVGGPQYRVGSHRQFVLLARDLAAAGVACLRFDYRGMGDSEGEFLGFEHIDTDLRAAVDILCRSIPSVEKVVLWGLCDGASACALYAPGDARVAGLALFNPWVRTEAGEAETALKHYYARRAFNRSFWAKLLVGKVSLWQSASSFVSSLRRAIPLRARSDGAGAEASLPDRIGQALLGRQHAILIGLSGKDTVSAEFRIASSKPGPLAALAGYGRVSTIEFPNADHTFSSAQWRDEAVSATLDWLRRQFPATMVVTDPPGIAERIL